MRRETWLSRSWPVRYGRHAETGKPVRCAIVSVRGMGQAGPELPNRRLGIGRAQLPKLCRASSVLPANTSAGARKRFAQAAYGCSARPRENHCAASASRPSSKCAAPMPIVQRKCKGSVGPRLRAIWKHSIALDRQSPVDLRPAGAVPGPDAATVECEGALEMGLRRRELVRQCAGSSQQSLHLRIAGIEFGRAHGEFRRLLPLGRGVLGEEVTGTMPVAPGRERDRQRIAWRQFHCPLQQFERPRLRPRLNPDRQRQRRIVKPQAPSSAGSRRPIRSASAACSARSTAIATPEATRSSKAHTSSASPSQRSAQRWRPDVRSLSITSTRRR